jgi:hypothetical protein
MTYEEAREALKTHSPWVRMSEEMIKALTRPKKVVERERLDEMLDDTEEALF